MIYLKTLSPFAKYLRMMHHYFPKFSIKTFPVIISDRAYQWKVRFNLDPNNQAQEVYVSQETNKEGFKFLNFNGSNVETCSSQENLGLIMDDKRF